MTQATSDGRYNNKNRNYIIGGVVVAIIIGAFAYYNGYFGNGSTATPNADGSPSTTNTTNP